MFRTAHNVIKRRTKRSLVFAAAVLTLALAVVPVAPASASGGGGGSTSGHKVGH
jgi:hypothetical protein